MSPLTKDKISSETNSFDLIEVEDVRSAVEGMKQELCNIAEVHSEHGTRRCGVDGHQCMECKVVDKWFPAFVCYDTQEFKNTEVSQHSNGIETPEQVREDAEYYRVMAESNSRRDGTLYTSDIKFCFRDECDWNRDFLNWLQEQHPNSWSQYRAEFSFSRPSTDPRVGKLVSGQCGGTGELSRPTGVSVLRLDNGTDGKHAPGNGKHVPCALGCYTHPEVQCGCICHKEAQR